MFGRGGNGDIEFALRLRADLEEGQRELRRLIGALEDTDQSAAQAGRRIGDMVAPRICDARSAPCLACYATWAWR